MLFAEVRHRKILFEKIFVVAPGVLRHGVGVVVSYGKEWLRRCEQRFIVLMSFDLGCAYGVVAPGLDDVLVGTLYVAVFPECPGPAVEVDGLVMYGGSGCDGGFVVNSGVDRAWRQSSKKGSGNLRPS